MGIMVTTTATVSRIDWLGLIIACPECGAAEDLTVRARSTPCTYGESADIKCSHGHAWDHPLVYPAVVHYVAARAGLSDVGIPGWHPHVRTQWSVDEGSLDGQHFTTYYCSWGSAVHLDREWWQDNWPELLDTARSAGYWTP